MRNTLWSCAFLLPLIYSTSAYAFDGGGHLNQPPPPAVKALVRQAILLAERDKPRAAIAALKKAIAISPNYLPAHIEYGNIKADYLERSDEVVVEYRALTKRFPRNAVYRMALYLRHADASSESLAKIVELAPEWAWGHFAKALLINATDLDAAIRELKLCIQKDSNAYPAYEALINWQENRLRRIDDAIHTAELLASQTDLRAQRRLPPLWRLRLVKGQRSQEAKEVLASELRRLENSSDVDTLLAVRHGYLNLLEDEERARLIESKIRRVDPTWTPYRELYRVSTRNFSEVPRQVVLINRQRALWEEVVKRARATSVSPEERIAQLKELLNQKPNSSVRRKIYEDIFHLAVRSGKAKDVRTFGRLLHAIDPQDSVLLSQMALVLADSRTHLVEALSTAHAAEKLTATFQRAARPRNTSQMWLDFLFPEEKQRAQYKRNRALALHAVGWALTRTRQAQRAEPLLRQTIAIEPTQKRYSHLARTLQMLGRHDEAAAAESRGETFLADKLRSEFTNEPIEEFQFESTQGRKLKLSDLKGRVVLINFWATWCIPCIAEMAALKKMHEKYADQGLEIIAISIDDDAGKVPPFEKQQGLNFTVVQSPKLAERFNATSIPLSLFIDRRGNLRFRRSGFTEGDERELEIVIKELLK